MIKILLLSLCVFPMIVQAALLNTKKTDEYGNLIYKGQETVSGTYSRSEDLDGLSTCFTVDKKDFNKIPRPKGDERIAWFCFSNESQVNKAFKLPQNLKKGVCSYEGKATITIQNYSLFTAATEGSDQTKFITAKNVTPYKTIKCTEY